jgi:hypothetical protein
MTMARQAVSGILLHARPDIEPGSSISGSESDPTTWSLRGFHQGTDRVEDPAELSVILSFESVHLPGQFLVGYEHPPHPDKRPHDGNIDLHCSMTLKDTGKHRNALLGESVGEEFPMLSSAGL